MTTNKPQTIESKVNNLVNKQDLSIVSLHKLISVLYKEVTYKQIPAGLRERFTKPLEDHITGEEWDQLIAFMISDKYVISIRGYKAGGDILQKMKAILKGIFKDVTKPKRLPDPPAEITIEANPSDQVNYQEAVARTHADDFKPGIGMKIVNAHGYKEDITKFINPHTSSQTLGDFTMAQAPDNSVLVTQIGDLVYHDIHKAPAYEYKVHLAERAQQLVRDHLSSVPNILSLATPCFTQLATLHAIQNDTLIIADEDKDFFIRIFNNDVFIPNQYDIFKPYIDKLEQALTNVIPNYIYLASSYTLALRDLKETSIAAVDIYFNRYVVNPDLAQPLNMKHKQLVALIALMKDKYMSNTQYQPQPIHPVNPGPYQDPNLFQNPAPHGTYPTNQMSQMQRPTIPGYVPMDRSRRGDAGYRQETPQMSPWFLETDVLGVKAMNPFGMGSGGRRMDMFSGSLQTTAMQYAADRTVNHGVTMIHLLEEVAELNKQIDEKTRERERLLHDVKQLAKDLVFLNKE